MYGKLYVVATPIGNSGDITDRAKRILGEVDIIAAEDTRTSQKLPGMPGIPGKLVSNHKFNERSKSGYLISELTGGRNVAIISDAGTPCISDPGYIIVKSAIEKGIEVVSVCGASSVTAALSVSGFDLSSFAFYGFMPREGKDIKNALRKISRSDVPVSVFFESPRRVKKTLSFIAQELPGCDICLCNDLTKLHERIYRGTPQSVLDEILANPASEKGEYTLIIRINDKPEKPVSSQDARSPESMIVDYIVKNGGTLKDAVRALQEEHKGGISKNEFYKASLSLKEMMKKLL